MVVEPNPFLANLYYEKLGKLGHAVVLCKTGEESIHRYNQELGASFSSDADNGPFDVVMVGNGDKNIIQAAEEITSVNPRQKILLTASSKKDALSVGFPVEIIEKPFSITSLIERLGRISHKPMQNPYLNN